jgi:hypothetical protein
MAQIVKLRRSSVSGQKPTNTNLQLGELAQNTTDGKIFLAKSGSGGPSIEEIIVTNTSNTGSINLLGSVTASNFTGAFIGDGSQLYNIPATGVTGLQLDRITSGNVSASISPSLGLVINTGVTITGSISATEFTGSGLGLTNVPFHITGSDVDGNTYNKQFTKLQFDDSTGLNVSESVPGTAFVSIGSHFRDIFVSGSDMLRATGSDAFEIIPEGGIEVTTSITDTNSNGYIKELRLSTTTLSSSFDTRIDNLSSSVVYQSETSSMTVLSSSYALTASFALNAGAGAEGRTYVHPQLASSTTWTVNHNLNEYNPAITVYDINNNVIVPATITSTTSNQIVVTFPSAQTGKVSVTVGGGLPHISASYVNYVLAVNNDIPYWKGGLISGSSQITLSGTTDYTTFSSSIASTITSLSSSIAATDLLDDQRLDSLETASGSIRTDFNSFTSSYLTVSGSLDSRLDVLETYSSSQLVPSASMSFRTLQTDVYCKNTTGTQINKGTVVRIAGSVGDNPLISIADPNTEHSSANTLGITTENIPNDGFGLVITEGVLVGVNTDGMTGGDLLYLGANGTFTTTTPIAPAHGVRLGEVLRVQQNNGSIYVRIDNGMELNEVHDVIYSGITTGDLLYRSGSVWTNTKTLSGSYLFVGTQTISGSIIPSVDNLYDLGSPTHQWKDVYISSGSLYVDGVKVISSTTQELQITTDAGQSIKILEAGSDSIVLQTADGDIELKSSGGGDVLLDPTNGIISIKGTTQIQDGFKITSSGGTNVVFGDGIVVSGSIDLTGTIEGIDLTQFSASVNSRLGGLESSTGSLNSFTSSTLSSLSSLHTSTSSLNSYTASTDGRLSSIETSTGSLNTFSSSTNSRLTSIETSTGSLNTFSSSTNSRLSDIETSTGSLNSHTSSTNSRLTAIETSTGSLNSYTSSNNTIIGTLQTATGSLNTFSSSTNTRLGALETESGSVRTAFNSYTSSNDSTNTTQNGKLTSLEGKTGSYATTGSNTFIGNQTITGSLIVTENLLVYGSSSITYITASQLAVSSSVISVNVFEPAERFGGLKVYDSGSLSHLSTASLLWDSLYNHWIYQNASGSSYSGGMLLSGPRNTGSLGEELGLTSTRIPKSVGGDHLDNSNIYDDGSKVKIISNTEITGTFVVTGTALVSGSSQIDHNSTTNYVANEHINHTSISISAGNGLSGGGDISSTRTLTLDTGSAHFTGGVKSKMNTDGVISGSAQIVAVLPSGTVSGSSQVLNGSGVWSGSAQLPSGVVSGSSQVSYNGLSNVPSGIVSGSGQVVFGSLSGLPSGLVSGSSQISFGSISGLPSGLVSGSGQVVYSQLSGIPSGIVSSSSQVSFFSLSGLPSGLVSGSGQVVFGSLSGLPSGLVSGSSQVSFFSLSGLPSGLVSGSGQVVYSQLSGIPSGIVSGSSQISFGSISGIPSGLVSGSSQISFGSISGIPSGLVSGSSQISFGSISGIPSGLVSGSGQITLSSTSGFSSYLNQAVLTSSSPTFNTVTVSASSGFYLGDTGAGLYRDNTYDVVLTQNNSSGGVLYLGGAGNVIVSIDNNNNETDRKFIVGSNAVKASNELFSVAENGNTYVSGYLTVNGAGTSSSIYMNDSDEGQREIHCNSNQIGFLTQAGSWGAYLDDSNNWYANGSMRSPIFYDSNDTGYYGDFASESRFNTFTTAGRIVIGGTFSNNAYNTVSSTRLHFGGGNSDANDNYYIGTNLEDYGGNYTKLDLRWHTGIRMGAQAGYGGIRFYNSEDLGSVLFSIGTGDGNVRSHTNLLPSANNSYNLGSSSLGWANVYTNDLHLSNMNKPEGNDIDGTNGNWTIQEGAENLYIINNNNGKKYKISLEEI